MRSEGIMRLVAFISARKQFVLFLSIFNLSFHLPLFSQESVEDEARSQQPVFTGPDFDKDALPPAKEFHYSPELKKIMPGFDQRLGKCLGTKKAYEAFRLLTSASLPLQPLGTAWQPVGTSISGRISGRIKNFALDGITHRHAYLATSSGGIWKTDDISAANVSWINIGDNLPTLGIGAVAVDPLNKDIVYAGTGSNPGSDYNQSGVGLFRSTDGGLNWKELGDTSTFGYRCASIIIDPNDHNKIFVATGWQTFDKDKGVIRSTDGGNSWKQLTVTDTGFSACCVVIDPTNSTLLYAGGSLGGIYRSTDGGDSWIHCTTGVPGNSGRTQLAFAPSAPNVIYAGIAKSGQHAPALGIYKSDDFGATWRRVNICNSSNRDSPQPNYMNIQGDQMNSIVIDPKNSAHIFVGGLDIYSSADSGKTLQRKTDWNTSPDNFNDSNFVHGDIQSLQFVNDTLYACTDGGIARSADMGASWTNTINDGLSTLQFVGVDADNDLSFFVGGSQDNGQDRIEVLDENWTQTHVGDGGRTWVSPSDPDTVYSTYIYADFRKSADGGRTWLTSPNTGTKNFISNQDFLDESTFTFYPNYDVSASGDVVAMLGTFHVYVSKDGGEDGFEQRSESDVYFTFSVSISQQDPNRMWASGLGFSYHSSDMGLTWDTVSIGGADAGVPVIYADPYKPNVVYTLYYGYETRIYKSTDGGITWNNISNAFPQVGPNAMVTTPSGLIFIATSEGVICSQDDGATWSALNFGMPNVPVLSLRLKGTNHDKLVAGTFGRGAYWLDIGGITKGVASESKIASSVLLDLPHPNIIAKDAHTTLDLSLGKISEATIALYDILGREIRVFAKDRFEEGHQTIDADLHGIETGSYYVILTANGVRASQKLIVIQ